MCIQPEIATLKDRNAKVYFIKNNCTLEKHLKAQTKLQDGKYGMPSQN